MLKAQLYRLVSWALLLVVPHFPQLSPTLLSCLHFKFFHSESPTHHCQWYSSLVAFLASFWQKDVLNKTLNMPRLTSCMRKAWMGRGRIKCKIGQRCSKSLVWMQLIWDQISWGWSRASIRQEWFENERIIRPTCVASPRLKLKWFFVGFETCSVNPNSNTDGALHAYEGSVSSMKKKKFTPPPPHPKSIVRCSQSMFPFSTFFSLIQNFLVSTPFIVEYLNLIFNTGAWWGN